MVRQWQELFNDRRYSFVDIQSPDFVELAKSYRIDGQKVTNRSTLKNALKEMLDTRCLFAGNHGGKRKQCVPDGSAGMQCE